MLHDAPAACWPPLRAFHPPPCALVPRRRAFYDKRVSQEVDGECLGEVRRLPPPAAAASCARCSAAAFMCLAAVLEGQHSMRQKLAWCSQMELSQAAAPGGASGVGGAGRTWTAARQQC